MKLLKAVCLGFGGQELEGTYWQELDTLIEERVIADEDTTVAEHSNADGLFVKLGAKIDKGLHR